MFSIFFMFSMFCQFTPWPPILDGRMAQLVEPCVGCRGAGRRATSPSTREPWSGGAAPARSDYLSSTTIFRFWKKELIVMLCSLSKERQNTILRRSALSKSEPLWALEAANMSNELKVMRSKTKRSKRRSIFFRRSWAWRRRTWERSWRWWGARPRRARGDPWGLWLS